MPPKPPKPSKGEKRAKADAPLDRPAAPKRSFLDRALDALAGARLCYGEPVRTGDRTVIPVARVRVAGGGGFGRGGETSTDSGGGGGGFVEAHPLGFVEVSPEGTRYIEIPDPERTQRLMRAGAGAIATLAAGLAGARRLRGGAPSSRRLLGR